MIRVGNAQAFWGDRPSAAAELLAQVPDLDFLTMDYLAEVSMSILALQRDRDPERGYPQDFVEVVRKLASYWASGGQCKLIANAGGLNPGACAQACQQALESSGCRALKIAVVSGDDVLAQLQQPSSDPALFRNLDTNESLARVREHLVTANAYTGCEGIVAGLRAGADIVITGRVADPAMVAAACVYAFDWRSDDWDRLAGATIAGHLLECGTQVTGGISSDWLSVPDRAHLGFPIAEIHPDGRCTITKPPASGGQVTAETVKEQLVYEIGDPDNYLSPDVRVSFLNLEVIDEGSDRVSVRGAKGRPRPETLKVSATYRNGYRAAGMLTFFGPQSALKARQCGDIVLQRLSEAGCKFCDTIVECLGSAGSLPLAHLASHNAEAFETVLRMAVESDDRSAVEQFANELIPLITSGPQGTTGYAEGRPRVHPVFRYWPCLIASGAVQSAVQVFVTRDTLSTRAQPASWPTHYVHAAAQTTSGLEHAGGSPALRPTQVSRLSDLAYGRSGDKGANANIGILARSESAYQHLKNWLTSEHVQRVFAPLGAEAVERFEMPNLLGFNFLVRGVLRRTLRNDAQGKALAQALLSLPLDDW